MLRFVRERDDDPWRPAAGTFPGWPKEAKDITMLDPCCGSGHFLTEALVIFTALRQIEEGLSPADAVAAALRENLHGLEIDERCVQIAVLLLRSRLGALAAGKFCRCRILPWVGAPPPLPKREFMALAEGDPDLETARGFHELFVQAPTLGSLSSSKVAILVTPAFGRNSLSYSDKLLKGSNERNRTRRGCYCRSRDGGCGNHSAERYIASGHECSLPGRGKQTQALADFIGRFFPDARADLATSMLMRMTKLAERGGTVASVTPQNWLFLGSYKKLREHLLDQSSLNWIAVLGEHSFESMAAAGAFTALAVLSNEKPEKDHLLAGLDAHGGPDPLTKAIILKDEHVHVLNQREQRANPDARISVHGAVKGALLAEYADSFVGFQNGDTPRWVQHFWERKTISNGWSFFQLTSDETKYYDGRHSILKWDQGRGELAKSEQARVQGTEAWEKKE